MTSERRVALEELNGRHRVSSAQYYTQRHFCRRHGIGAPIPLCAGLIQVWWDELQKGNDGIRSLQNAGRPMVREVLLAQARSVYLKNFPADDEGLTPSERELLEFKYGEASLSAIEALKSLFGVDSALELDLVLQHGLPIVEERQFHEFGPAITQAVTENTRPGLRVLLTRYERRRVISGEIGHRSALVIEPEGGCRFYDPSRGEVRFSAVTHFGEWFAEFWSVARWTVLLQVGKPSSPPIRIFSFGGRLSPEAQAKRLQLQRRIGQSTLFAEWLERGPTAAQAKAAGGLEEPIPIPAAANI